MHTRLMNAVSAAVVFQASLGFAAPFERADSLRNAPATCNCRNASDCTCPKGKCSCKGCGVQGGAPSTMFESLKGATQTTRLPNTARVEDARGGVLL